MRIARRQALKALVGVALLVRSGGRARAAAPQTLKFFDAQRGAEVAALAETIVPTDDYSPGARDAKVHLFIDRLMLRSSRRVQREWLVGLADLSALARTRFGAAISSLSEPQLIELLTEVSQHEGAPTTSLERFFETLKGTVVMGYYRSEIGIHRELRFKANVPIVEFVGCTHGHHGT